MDTQFSVYPFNGHRTQFSLFFQPTYTVFSFLKLSKTLVAHK